MSVLKKYSKFLDEKQLPSSTSSPRQSVTKPNNCAVPIQPTVSAVIEDELVEENCSSLWQYCIQDPDDIRHLEIILPILMLIFYTFSFYVIITYLLNTPIYHISKSKQTFEGYALLLCKWVFTLILCIQAECECYDGWRIYLLAEGQLKRILFFGSMQYISGCFVEIISYSLIDRSANILNIMTYSASLTVFLRIDDLVMTFINKFFPTMTKKITFKKNIPSKRFLYWTLAFKITYFVVAEIMNQVYDIQIFI